MFLLRSIFWLSTVVVLLPASPDGREPAPRVSLLHTAYAARTILQDMTGVCRRNPMPVPQAAKRSPFEPEARDRRGDCSHRIRAGQSADQQASTDHGTLTETDLETVWSMAQSR